MKIVRPERVVPDPNWAQINDQNPHGLPEHIGEADFQETCEAVARSYGWTVFHSNDSRRSDAGLPDLVMFSRPLEDGHRVLALIELKTNKGKPTAVQEQWLLGLRETDHLVTGWMQPRHWLQFVQLCFDPVQVTHATQAPSPQTAQP